MVNVNVFRSLVVVQTMPVRVSSVVHVEPSLEPWNVQSFAHRWPLLKSSRTNEYCVRTTALVSCACSQPLPVPLASHALARSSQNAAHGGRVVALYEEEAVTL